MDVFKIDFIFYRDKYGTTAVKVTHVSLSLSLSVTHTHLHTRAHADKDATK